MEQGGQQKNNVKVSGELQFTPIHFLFLCFTKQNGYSHADKNSFMALGMQTQFLL